MLFSTILYVYAPQEAHGAQPVPITLQQIENLALNNSSQYETKLFKYNRLCKSYQSTLKSVSEKWKDYGTIRFSLLFNIKWPEYPYMDEAMDLYTKGPGVMVQINAAVRELYDIEFQVKSKADTLYVAAYKLQTQIDFNEEQLDTAKRALLTNKNRLATGDASAKDVDTCEKKVESLEQEQISLLRTFTTKMKTISDLIGMDITTGYKLVDPLVTAEIDRVEDLPSIKEFALYWDLAVYQSDLDVTLDKYTVNQDMQLLNSKYGASTKKYITPYVNQILNGTKVNSNAFQKDYDKFLAEIDAPWNGSYKILFIRIPKEWFKGKLSGQRYLENSITAPLDDALTLQEDIMTNRDLRKTLVSTIEDTYNSVMDAKTAYTVAVQAAADAKENLEKVLALNKIGQATYMETQDAQQLLQDAELSKLETLCSYTDLLYSLDRITYGAISKLLAGESISLDSGAAGISYADLVDENKAYYYIQTMVQNMSFLFGVDIPNDFEPDITDYELWYDDYQIGERTPIDKQIIHLTIDYAESNKLTLRLYNSGEFVNEVEVDANVPRGEINLEKATEEVAVEKIVGRYELKNTGDVDIAATVISFEMKEKEGIAYYTIVDSNDKSLIKDDYREISKEFKYLSLLAGNISTLKMKCFDSEKILLYTARFDEDNMEMLAMIE